MIQVTSRLSRAARLRRRFPFWAFPLAGTVGMLIVLLLVLFRK